jgi:tetratricopeptide (TPR) repeat protein
MEKKYRIPGVLLILFLLMMQVVMAQKTDFYQSPELLYRKALELYRQENYGAAEKMFDLFLNRLPEKQNLQAENAAYYAANCAVKLQQSDALVRLSRFLSHYPESVWISAVKFSVGSAYFNNRRYSQALKVFDEINKNKLNLQQQHAYAYEKGYCLLKRNKTADAMSLFQQVMHTQSPYAAPAAYYYGYTQYVLKNYDAALSAFSLIKDDPRFRKTIPIYLMQIYYRHQQFEKVVSLGKKYLPQAQYSLKTEMNRLMANSFFEMGHYAGALPYFVAYEKQLRSNIPPEEAYRMGLVYFKNQKYVEAVFPFQRATDAGNKKVAQSAWYYLAQCYLKTARPSQAQNAFVSAYRMDKTSQTGIQALLAYAEVSIRQKGDRNHDAVSLVQELVNNPQVSAVQRSQAAALLAQLYVNTHNNLAALSSIERAGVKQKSLQAAYQKLAFTQAADFYAQRRFARALTYFKKAAKYAADRETYLKSLYWQASCYYRLRQYTRAAQAYKLFLSSRNAFRSPLYVPAYYDLAYAYFKQKNYPQALAWFKRFLNQHYSNSAMTTDAQLRVADSYTLLEQYAKAHVWYGKVIAAHARQSDYALYEEAFCYGAQTLFPQKIKSLQRLVQQYPHSPYYTRALYDLATTYATILNQPRQGIAYFQRIVKEKPTSSYARMARVKMGLLYYKNNQYDKAIQELKAVIAAYPASGEARVALSTLESIYKDKGEPAAYFAYARTLHFVQISKSQEDSLTFAVGEDAYLAGNCAKAEQSLKKYLQQFPQGGFLVKSWHYLAACYGRRKDTTESLKYLKKIIAWPENDFTLPSLVKAARMEYARRNYSQAAAFYSKVEKITEDPSLKLEAVDGQMRSDFLLGKLTVAARAASKLLRMPEVSEDQTVYAHFVLAKAAWKAGNMPVAQHEFSITDHLSKGFRGAESKYYLAHMHFKSKQYDEAEKTVYALSDQYPGEMYWVAKGFILLADVYVAKGNVFQARETLKSIIANYPGSDLKQLAQKKLAALPQGKSTVSPKSKKQKK